MVSETLANPGAEIFDVIHYFGTRGKLFDVHFRNIRGHRDDFVETHPDDGDVDFLKAAILRLRLRLHPRSYSIGGRTELSVHTESKTAQSYLIYNDFRLSAYSEVLREVLWRWNTKVPLDLLGRSADHRGY